MKRANKESTTKYAGSFPSRLYDMLEDAADQGFEHIVSWLPNGVCFKVHKQKELVDLILPKYYDKQTKYKSFQRQLNMYEFIMLRTRRYGKNDVYKGAFFHPLFTRENRESSEQILRKTIIVNEIQSSKKVSNPGTDISNPHQRKSHAPRTETGNKSQEDDCYRHRTSKLATKLEEKMFKGQNQVQHESNSFRLGPNLSLGSETLEGSPRLQQNVLTTPLKPHCAALQNDSPARFGLPVREYTIRAGALPTAWKFASKPSPWSAKWSTMPLQSETSTPLLVCNRETTSHDCSQPMTCLPMDEGEINDAIISTFAAPRDRCS